jgi:hypothetical protein
MPSRKTLLGAGALVLIALVVVLVTGVGRGHSLEIERGDGSDFPLRGSLADDQQAIDDALDAWKDGRGGAGDSRAARVTDSKVHLLYAGRVDEVEVVLVRQGTRLIAMRQPLDRGWVVSDARENFDPYDGSPVTIDGAVLLPTGDWTYLPLRGGGLRPLTADGLISDGHPYGSLVDPAFVVEGTEPVRSKVTKVYDAEAGLFSVKAETLRRIMDASRRPGGLTAIHAALVQHDAEPRTLSGYRPLEVLWTGRLPGVRQAAIVALKDVHKLGLGLVSDPDAVVSRAASVSLGSLIGPLSAGRRDEFDPPYVGATYIGGGEEPMSLVAAATGSVDRIEFLVGKRRFTRPGPVAVVPVDWDAERTDAVVVGRTAGDAVIAPLVPQLP